VLHGRREGRLLAVHTQFKALLDELADALHDAPPGALAPDVNHHVIGVAREAEPTPVELVVKVVKHDIGKQR
jgi:hypothetical protein